jgi:hypothetical protein
VPRVALIISYEFPPTGGSGVQRISKFSRYLPRFGWTPIVLAATAVPGRPVDPSLSSEVSEVRVVRTPARHVATAISRLISPLKRRRDAVKAGTIASSNAAQEESDQRRPTAVAGLAKPSWSRRLARWIAVPDDAAFWKGPATREAVRLGRLTGAEAVIATGPPFSALVVGRRAADALGVPFIADLRDAWETNPTLSHPTSLHRARSRALERKALTGSARVITAAPPAAEEARKVGAVAVEVLPNGFDPNDLPARVVGGPGGGDLPLRLNFMGRVYAGHADPTLVISAMERLAKRGAEAALIEFDVVGSWPVGFESVATASAVASRVHLHGYRPHLEALEIAARADVGVALVADNPGAQGTTPAKIFEYLGMGIPVLLIGPLDGYPAQILSETSGGVCIAPDDPEGLDAALARFAELRSSAALPVPDPAKVRRYDRIQQARRLAEILDEATTPRNTVREAHL